MPFRGERDHLFTHDELNSLLALRDDYTRGEDPARSRRSFEERYGISITNRPADSASPPLYWWSHLRRETGDGSYRELTAKFCAVPERPIPPSAHEVLQWLAMGVAHRLLIPDRRQWAALYRMNRSGQAVSPCYRGIVRTADTTAAFEAELRAEHTALLTMLGRRGFAELMYTAGIELPGLGDGRA